MKKVEKKEKKQQSGMKSIKSVYPLPNKINTTMKGHKGPIYVVKFNSKWKREKKARKRQEMENIVCQALKIEW